MWPINVPASRLLSLPRPAWITWAVFDAGWYRANHGDALAHLANASDEAVMRFYLETGQTLGHPPIRCLTRRGTGAPILRWHI